MRTYLIALLFAGFAVGCGGSNAKEGPLTEDDYEYLEQQDQAIDEAEEGPIDG